MNRPARVALALGLALAAWGVPGCRNRQLTDDAPRVSIHGHTWTVELAATDEQRYRGLSGRASIGQDRGMLFVYPSERALEFCMRECLVPIDIVFLDANRRVVGTYHMKVDSALGPAATYVSQAPAQYALEVAAGEIERAGIRAGDVAEFHGAVPDASKAEGGP